METVIAPTASEVLTKAQEIVDGEVLPDEIDRIVPRVGPDHHGNFALWLVLHVKKTVKDTPQSVKAIGEFGRALQAKMIERHVGMFPYIAVEQPR